MRGDVRQRKDRTRLAKIRCRRGVTQRELSETTGVPLTVIQRLESGRIKNPRIQHLRNLAIALDVSLDRLCERDWREWSELHSAAPEPPDLDAFLGPWRDGDVTRDLDD